MKNIWSWVGIVILIALLGWAGYYGWQQRGAIEELRNQLANQNNSLQNQIGNFNQVVPVNNIISNQPSGESTGNTLLTGWKKYESAELGISISYPNSRFKYMKSGSYIPAEGSYQTYEYKGVFFESNQKGNGASIDVRLYENLFERNNIETLYGKVPLEEQKEKVINGIKMYQWSIGDGGYLSTVYSMSGKGGHRLDVWFTDYNNGTKSDIISADLINQILQTVKFI